MAFSVNATDSGLLMISMMGALLVASVVSGQLVPKTGRYNWMPIACSSQHPAGTNQGGHQLLL
ncbi:MULTISPECIES: MFS transporter [Pseudarthrobacter]|uniref:MFS transporter n=1 Tax=Pseudarthrobacter TaxID=1742993 RepID=UPI0011B0E532|nr:MFS transporter [Pseudarthrobacter sp. NCCP-2145]MBD1539587.1 MFS transporter [Arthrobacter sp. S13_S34]